MNDVTVPTPSGSSATDRENTEKGFVAPQRLRESLQGVVVHVIDLQLIAKQAHWNIVGPNFRDLHRNLDELVTVTREAADTLAERMRALHATPDGRAAVVAGTSTLPQFPAGEITTHDAIYAVVMAIDLTARHIRDVHDGVDEDDPTSADLLHAVLKDLEQQSWFIGAEVRKPAASSSDEGSSNDEAPTADSHSESYDTNSAAAHTGLPGPASSSRSVDEDAPKPAYAEASSRDDNPAQSFEEEPHQRSRDSFHSNPEDNK